MSFISAAQRATVQDGQTQASLEKSLLDKLRTQVVDLLSVDRLAVLSQSNQQLARAEVRGACRRVFANDQWRLIDEGLRHSLEEELLDLVFGYGAVEALLEDPSVTEIMVNGPDKVFYERDGVIYPYERSFPSELDLRSMIDRILGPLGRRVDEASPMVNARLPQGHRVNVVVSPVSLVGPVVTIRKFSEHVITLKEMELLGSVEPSVARFLIWAVKGRKSIAVSGGTGSGKTTLLNALSCEIDPHERIITIEDSAELRFFEHPHVVSLEARAANGEGLGEVTIRDLVINALRMRPDRIVVGECRGAEALDMLSAMSTGHDGSLTTLHANSPKESIARLATMVRYGADLPVDVIEANIASAIHLVVQTQRMMDGSRAVTDIVELYFDDDRRRCLARPLYQRKPLSQQGVWLGYPSWLKPLAEAGVIDGQEVEQWIKLCSLG